MTNRKLYYLISFIEGASVMATEIIGAKMLAPFFGSSLYVWSSVMAITLGGLAAGYFAGGRMSQKENNKGILFSVFFASGIFIIALPVVLKLMSPLAFQMGLLSAVLLCSSVILLPPVFCMGMISPLIIQQLTQQNDGGKRAGEIYAISTLGGIIATFLTGFYLIPVFGLTYPLLVFGALMVLCSFLYFKVKTSKNLLLIFALVLASGMLVASSDNDGYKAIYKSEGLLGTLEVMEENWDMDSLQKNENHRLLLINNIIQTWQETNTKKSYLDYVDQIEEIAAQLPGENKKALILGLGGGMVATKLSQKGFQVTCVELDARIAEVARKYFALPAEVYVITDDARHAIESMTDKYDLILVDLFNGEVTPSHVMSIESLQKMKSLLNSDGFLLFNTYGYIQSPAGDGNKALLKTITSAGFTYNIGWTGTYNHEDYRNFVITCTTGVLPQLSKSFSAPVDLRQAELITDDRPVLEYLNARAAKRWRYYYLQNFIRSKAATYNREKQ